MHSPESPQPSPQRQTFGEAYPEWSFLAERSGFVENDVMAFIMHDDDGVLKSLPIAAQLHIEAMLETIDASGTAPELVRAGYERLAKLQESLTN